jgi:hypothetical protein
MKRFAERKPPAGGIYVHCWSSSAQRTLITVTESSKAECVSYCEVARQRTPAQDQFAGRPRLGADIGSLNRRISVTR